VLRTNTSIEIFKTLAFPGARQTLYHPAKKTLIAEISIKLFDLPAIANLKNKKGAKNIN
jgi:hypothetical protein